VEKQDKPDLILADWSESEGPIIVKAIFSPQMSDSTTNSPEVLVTRCYISAESIFAKERFAKIQFNLPMVTIKKLAVVLFDTVSDTTVRGDLRPFLLVIFVPLDTKYAITDAIIKVAGPYVDEYKNGLIPDMETLQLEVGTVLEQGNEAEGPAKDALKKEFSMLVKEHLARMASLGVTLKIYICPGCGFKIYPDEIACTRCKFLIRTYCSRCNSAIERNLKSCPRCGQKNPKYDPSVILVAQEEEDELDVLRETGIAESVKDKKIADVLGVDIEKDFDESNAGLEKEIEELKSRLDEQQKKATKARLFESFTRNYGGYKVGDKDISERSLESTFRDPAIDEVDLLIKSMAVLPPEQRAKTRPEKLLAVWDCDAYMHAAGRVLVGLGNNPEFATGIPGSMYVMETAIAFVSYQEEFAGIAGLFAYFDASLQFLDACDNFSPTINKNAIVFKNHGLCQSKLPVERTFSINFSWADEKAKGDWKNQAILLKSMLERQQLFARKEAAPAGKFFMFAGKQPTDNSIKSILASLKIYFPAIIKDMREKYTMLF